MPFHPAGHAEHTGGDEDEAVAATDTLVSNCLAADTLVSNCPIGQSVQNHAAGPLTGKPVSAHAVQA